MSSLSWKLLWVCGSLLASLAQAAAPSWTRIDALIDAQKLEEASRGIEARLAQAKASGHQEEWARALVKGTQVRLALHGHETAVKTLKEQPWPQAPLARNAVNLAYAAALVSYDQQYSWELRQRERVASGETLELKLWTHEQVIAEAHRAFTEIWATRQALGTTPASRFGVYLDLGTYPLHVRGTLRDALGYLFVATLADSGTWSPAHSNEVFRLDAPALIRGGGAPVKLDDPAVHPLLKLGTVLDDLEAWHRGAGRREAELETRLERTRRLAQHLTGEEKRALLHRELETRLGPFRSLPWFAEGKLTQAQLHQADGDLVAAHRVAAEGKKAFPRSIGGKRCGALLQQLEAPDFQLASMATDGLERRSLQVTHKNLPQLFFRAYRLDVDALMAKWKDYSLLPEGEALEAWVAGQQPQRRWTLQLPATPDFQPHLTYETPPLTQPGLYLVMASAREDFSRENNRVVSTSLNLSQLVLVMRQASSTVQHLRVLDGRTGLPVPGATVEVYRHDWKTGHHKVDTRTTDARGVADWDGAPDGKENQNYAVVARHGAQHAFELNALHFFRDNPSQERTGAFVYTDRSIYRPNQKVRWKVVGFQGSAGRADFRTLAGRKATVSLHDANGQRLESREVTTNSFGSAAGEFLIPTGRALGAWSLQTSLHGGARIQVEEYKRPTFEAELPAPITAMRLNRPVTVDGTARYYFGQPVSSGTVRWSVVRRPRYPWWWGWYRLPVGNTQTVATGATILKDDGTFQLTFTPEAEEGVESSEVSYLYEVTAEITDEGGETRVATRGYPIGFAAVAAELKAERGFFRAGQPAVFTVRRTDLEGNPLVGAGSWRLFALQQPPKALLPAEEPLPPPPPGTTRSGYQTPGDALRPRWESDYQTERTLRGWKDGAQVAQGRLGAKDPAEARVEARLAEGGAYRLRYETQDAFGAKFQTQLEFVVHGGPVAVPLGLWVEEPSVTAGGKARVLVASALPGQQAMLAIERPNQPLERQLLRLDGGTTLIEVPVTPQDRGGLTLSLVGVRDHQLMRFAQNVAVPFELQQLELAFSTFRDRLRPGAKETFRVTVKGARGETLERGAAEVLGYMYDRSLDAFAAHTPPDPMTLFPQRQGYSLPRSNLGVGQMSWLWDDLAPELGAIPELIPASLELLEGYGVGGMGRRGPPRGGRPMLRSSAVARDVSAKEMNVSLSPPPPPPAPPSEPAASPSVPEAGPQLRSNFSETAFFLPQLLTGADGSVAFEFQVPDSVTSWNVWAHAITRDLRSGSVKRQTQSIKELMVRPYVPRFFREGDQSELQVAINSAATRPLMGTVSLKITELESGKVVTSEFLVRGAPDTRGFKLPPGKGTTVAFKLQAPRRVGTFAFEVVGKAGAFSDGELRPVPVLPGRLHLSQSRFAALHDVSRKVLRFEDLAANDDPTRVTEQLVVTIDAQLFYTALEALPYLVSYPYECTEQTLNRFVSTGIVSSLYAQHPEVGQMAKTLSTRKSRLEQWDAPDPNRKLLLEETPWLQQAQGGVQQDALLLNVLDPRLAGEQRDVALRSLQKMQTSVGAFPWFPGGPPSPYMTLYILHGLARAAEYQVPVPKELTVRAWDYVTKHYRSEYAAKLKDPKQEGCCAEFVTFLNYVASAFPDAAYTGDALTLDERRAMLDYSLRHWKEHSPYLKGYLALTLQRMGRAQEARTVFASVMDSAKTTGELGTFWAPEERGWLWYNDRIETHAFALRVLMELMPQDARRHGLVQWLLLNKKLGHWKSTRATAEVLYALVKYLEKEGALGVREVITVSAGPRKVTLRFAPGEFTGKKNQVVIDGDQVVPGRHSEVVVEKRTKGLAFASATWHFATDQLPREERGDFFSVSRRYFRRDKTGNELVLKPLEEGATLSVGDEVEVQLSLRAKHAAEFVHLQDPRAAGLEPDRAVSGYKWETGVAVYEETRDSATNFFFDWLPAGEYTLRYRLRANMAGTFRVGPATLQSMYAPEFNAYSKGQSLQVRPQP